MVKTVRYACVILAALFLIGAVVSFVVSFERIENTTTVLAGAATAFAFLGYAIRTQEQSQG